MAMHEWKSIGHAHLKTYARDILQKTPARSESASVRGVRLVRHAYFDISYRTRSSASVSDLGGSQVCSSAKLICVTGHRVEERK